jgi:hypothetical protein
VRTRALAAQAFLAESYGKPVQPTREEGDAQPIFIVPPPRDEPAQLPGNVHRIPDAGG